MFCVVRFDTYIITYFNFQTARNYWSIPEKNQTGKVEDVEFPGVFEERAKGISMG